MVCIGAHLQADGNDVVVVTGEEYRDIVHAGGMGFAPLGAAGRVAPPCTVQFPMPRLLRRYLFGLAEMRSTFVSVLTAQFETLSRVMASEPVDAILVDLAFTGVLPLLLSDEPRPPILAVGVGPLTLSSSDTPPFGMGWHPRPGMRYDGVNRVVDRMLRGIRKDMNFALAEVGARELPHSLPDWPRLADALLQLTVPAFEYPRSDLPASVQFVGPVVPGGTAHFEAPPWWEDALAAPKLVHVTQGTFDNSDLGQLIEPTLEALAAADVAVVATCGSSSERQRDLDIPRNAYVTDWVPYSSLLPHVDIMVTNGGYGGVQHALRHGIPLIVAGETSDKAEVAARVAYCGAGIDLATASPTVPQIRNAVERILATPTYYAAARRIGRDISDSHALEAIDHAVTTQIRSRRVHPA
jgi:hypothetical protein